MMKADVFIVSVLVALGRCNATMYDCGSTDSGEGRITTMMETEELIINIMETDPVETVLATFNNSFGDLLWAASVNGSSTNYLSLFFEASAVEGANHTHALKLAKILDLELLQLELVSSTQLFTDDVSSSVTLDLSVFCRQEEGPVNEWTFKIIIQSVNEFYPQFMGSPFKATVPESAAVGTEVFNIGARATDLDAGQTNLTFAIAPYMITQFDGSGYVALDNNGNDVIVLSRPLDFEAFLAAGRTYMFVNVTATDEGGFTSATSINVTVTDSNDQGVQLVYPGCGRPCLRASYSAHTNESFVGPLDVGPFAIHAEDLDSLNDSIVYTLISDTDKDFFDIDETTAMLFKVSPLVNDSYGYNIPVEVRAQEVSDEDHFIDFNVTISVLERLPKTVTGEPRNHDDHGTIERLEALEKQQQKRMLATLNHSPHTASEENKDEHKEVNGMEPNLQQAMDADGKVKQQESEGSDDRRHRTLHPRQSRITSSNVSAAERLASRKRQVSVGVAFSAYLDHDVDLGAHQTIKYNQIITNEGNGYSPHSGVFTCPEGGMYMFSFFIGQRDETVPRGIFAELMVNSRNILDAVIDSYSPGQDITGGNVAVIRLKQGDVVWVDSYGAGGHAQGSAIAKLTSFSGVFLFP